MKSISYKTTGTCSKYIDITADDNDIIQSVTIHGGCPGNTLGISQLVVGMKIDDVIARTQGVKCGAKPTSCPDQLSIALKQLKDSPSES